MRKIVICAALASVGYFVLSLGFVKKTAQAQGTPIPEPSEFMRASTIPSGGSATGSTPSEFSSSTTNNSAINPSSLPSRPFLGTETYWVTPGSTEAQWMRDLQLDVLRVEIDASEIEKGNDDSNANTDFSTYTKADFEGDRKGWSFDDQDALAVNVMTNYPNVVKFAYPMLMHYGNESFLKDPPNSEEYAEYFLANVYYYNVILGKNIKYWEILNEPDWGWTAACNSTCYKDIAVKVATKIKNHPDQRVNSIRIGGPALGSGDPIDGTWPDGYANKTSDDGRDWLNYMPKLLQQGSRAGQKDIGFLSWHDYGDTWGLPNNMYNMDNNYQVVNRVNAFDALAKNNGYPDLPLIVSEMNLDAGTTQAEGKTFYKNFYAALWHTSTLNNYFSTGKVKMLFHYYWKGKNDWPKGLVYQDSDSGNQLVKNPVYYAYQEYIRHLQEKILIATNGKTDRWVDASVTTDKNGKMFYLIAVNKSDTAKPINLSFNVPSTMLGSGWISKQTMVAGGSGNYGSAFAAPVISKPYQYQPISFAQGKQVKYTETIPARTIVYYTYVNTSSQSVTSAPTATLPPSATSTPVKTVIPTVPQTSPTGAPSGCSVADINQDNIVDLSDYAVMLSHFFQTNPSNPRADLDKDNFVDLNDYAILLSFFFDRCS